MEFTNKVDWDFYIRLYERLRHKLYKEEISQEDKEKYYIEEKGPKLWEHLTFNGRSMNLFGVSGKYFYDEYGQAKKSKYFSKKDNTLLKVLKYLGEIDNDELSSEEFQKAIREFLRKEKIDGAETFQFSEKLKKQANDGFAHLIGYTGNENVYLIVRKWFDPDKKLKNINEPDDEAYGEIKELLEKEGIKAKRIKFLTHEKKDVKGLTEASELLTDHYPNKRITIAPNDIFIIIGLYGYNIIPEITELDSMFFNDLLYKWEDPVGESEFTKLSFRGSGYKYGVEYRIPIEHMGGESHGIFSKIKYGSYTCIQIGGAGQEGTEALGHFFSINWKNIAKEILAKSTTPHSFAVLFWLNLDNYLESKIIDSTVISVH